ncbi:ribonuclease R [Paenibacillus sp. YYML68]|uniref:ribonuclease R n=1 Tax=Paenibacillus sp. YYML68 TaxID=2909250 RepID=UPI0024903E8C|nr:ribonuclease R [Paenibacillus sp. YYML68]
MVNKETVLDFMKETAYKPMTYHELEQHFELEDAEEFKSFLRLLNELENEGHILRTRNDRYGVPERMNLLRGRLQAHAKGFGFLIPDDKELPDVYIHANDMGTAMNGDIILVRVTSKGVSGGRLEGEVVRVVTRGNTRIVGLFKTYEEYAFVIPDDKRVVRDIFIPKDAFNGAMDGHKVVVNIVAYPEGRAAAQGEVIEILGHKNDPGVDILSIIRKHGLPESFPDEVMEEAGRAPEVITEEEIVSQGRRDLRGKRIVTIDGEDAKDLDDAVNVERLPNGNYVLGVHIADVSYYVREGSPLDREAYNRGCSVYLVDRVIPMLPHRLSNGICSLNPQVDRLTMSCEMEFDAQLNVVRHDVFTSVIRTSERMTYNNVKTLLTEESPDPELVEKYGYLMDDFRLMEELAMKLRAKRMHRGAIDFDFQEAKILVDSDGKPTEIIKRDRSIAEMIIEEFMLAANETVAEHFYWLKVPFLYRVHEDPDGEKLQHFMEFITNFGYVVRGKGNSIHPKALQSLLEEIKGTKEETVISTVLLRSMKQARYDAQSLGHYGLSAEYYSHFTSPIRRYPDLIIHRVIREVLESGTLSDARHEYLTARMEDIAKQSSERERVAVDAERETEALKKAEFMMDKVGEEFDGIISSVTSFGIFVELDNTVEGLIRLSDLHDDYYHFHEAQHALIGERTSRIYRLGDEVKVRVARVSMDEKTIDFEMMDTRPRGQKVSLVDALKAVRKGKRGGSGSGGGREGRSGGSGRRGGEGGAASGRRGGRGAGAGASAGRGDGPRGRRSGAPGTGAAARGGDAAGFGGAEGGRRGGAGAGAGSAGAGRGDGPRGRRSGAPGTGAAGRDGAAGAAAGEAGSGRSAGGAGRSKGPGAAKSRALKATGRGGEGGQDGGGFGGFGPKKRRKKTVKR